MFTYWGRKIGGRERVERGEREREKGREKRTEREREYIFIHCLISQMHTIADGRPSQKQEPGIETWFTTWVTGSQPLQPSPTTSRAWLNRELDSAV